MRRLSVISTCSAVRRQRPAVEQAADERGEVAVEQAARGEVDRDAQLEAVVAPRAALAERAVEHVVGEQRDEVALLRQPDEPLGRDEAELRVLPAHERLDAVATALAQRELRLVVDDELAALDAAAQLAGEREAVEAVPVALRRVQRPRPPRLLRRVERDVGVLEDLLGARAVLGVHRDAHRRAHVEQQPAELERHLERPRRRGGRAPRRRRRGRCAASSANSSPPQARDGDLGRQRRRAGARRRCTSSSSPCWWPSVSLTDLKSSRSSSSATAPLAVVDVLAAAARGRAAGSAARSARRAARGAG